MARLTDLPLFPLGVVLLPQEVMPLHIFEPRYREMVARCLAGPEPFCIALADDDGVRQVGCLAVGLEVLERFPDGRMNVVVTGGERVAIDRVDEASHAYLAADARVLEDEDDLAGDDAMSAAMEAYRSLLELAEGQDAPPDPEPGPRLSYAIAGRISFGTDVKQPLLEERSERTRLHEVTALVRGAAEAVRTERAVAARARTNGKVSAPKDVEPPGE